MIATRMVALPVSVARDGGARKKSGQGMAQACGETSMAQMSFTLHTSCNLTDPVTLAEKEVLERAVAKIVLLGEQVGVGTDQMIRLLNSGLSVCDLLEYLAMRAGNSA